MSQKTTRWRPDTCQCEVEFTWDDAVPQDLRTHALSKFNRKCPHHAALPDLLAWAALTEENPRKNKAISGLVDRYAAAWDQVPWYYEDGTRTLVIQAGAMLTAIQRTQAQGWCDANLGVGKVRIE